MNWRGATKEDETIAADRRYLVDIFPDTIPHQAGEDGNALVRISRPGWSWIVYDYKEPKKPLIVSDGQEETRAAAIAAAMSGLGEVRQ